MLIPVHAPEPGSPDSLPNTRIEYLYRDDSNYKTYNEAVVEGRFSEQDLDDIVRSLLDGEYFVPSKLGLPENKSCSDDNGPLFELYRSSFVPTAARPDAMTAQEFTAKCKALAGHWL